MILYHVEVGSFKNFSPWMCSAQPCENFYRIPRSMTSTFMTIVNCDLLDALYRVRRIKIANDIINQESDINFPRTLQFQASFDCVNKDKFSKTDLSDIPELPSELKTIDCLKK